jgi:putative tricarboxylic transport membrane protein
MAVARGGPIRSPQDFAAGLSLVGLAAFALWHSAELDAGTLGQMGPGMLPKGLAILTGLLGLAIAATAFRWPGPALERWSVRAPLFILGSVVLFGLTVRPLGLVVAGPLAFLSASLADRSARLVETLGYAALLTVLCLGLFVGALGLPIPIAPWLLGR